MLHAVARLSSHFAAGEMPLLENQQQHQQQPNRADPPLCTHQYSSAFGTYRKPTVQQDTLLKSPSSSHALVMSNGHMFSVPIKVQACRALSPNSSFVLGIIVANGAAPAPRRDRRCGAAITRPHSPSSAQSPC
jgi:hypothetical protein